MFLEMIKSISLKKSELKKRFVFINPELIRSLEKLDKSMIFVYGHYASYEWSNSLAFQTSFDHYGVYKPLRNRYFDALVKRIRSISSTKLIANKLVFRLLKEHEDNNKHTLTSFISDQSPKRARGHFFIPFMGIEVPCFTGAEAIAKKFNLSVSFLKISKVKRGYYQAEVKVLAENSKDFANFDITSSYYVQLEEQIREAPEYYLWTHKRWKHRLNQS